MPSPDSADRRASDHEMHIGQRLLAIVAVLLVIGALKITAPVTLPLTFALFLIAVFWPLQRRLERHVPRGAAALLALLLFLVVVALFSGALWLSADMVAQKAPQYEEPFHRLVERARSTASDYGLSLPGGSGAEGGETSSSSTLQHTAQRLLSRTTSFAVAFVLVVAFFVLGLVEVHDYHRKLEKGFGPRRGERWIAPVHRITNDFLRYIAVRTGVGLLTGTLVGLFSLLVGLDFAFIWGLLNFLLNYIPTLGSIIGIVPPVLFALFQFQGFEQALLVLLGIGGIQLVMGNYIDPLLQGKYLSLSAFVVLLSVTFWGWLWGIAGAFISIPITVAVVIACRQFERTRWIAVLLADVDADEVRQG